MGTKWKPRSVMVVTTLWSSQIFSHNNQFDSGDYLKQGIQNVKSAIYIFHSFIKFMIRTLTAGPWLFTFTWFNVSYLHKRQRYTPEKFVLGAFDMHRLTECLIVSVDKSPSFRLNILDMHLLTLNFAYLSSIHDSLLTISIVWDWAE